MRFNSFLAALALASLGVTPVLAGGDGHGHEHGQQPMYGGVLATASDVNYELVAKADSLTLYVVDHGKPVLTAGAKGSATLHAGSEKTTVALQPAGDNRLIGNGSFKSGVGVRVAATVALPGKPEVKLNFRLK